MPLSALQHLYFPMARGYARPDLFMKTRVDIDTATTQSSPSHVNSRSSEMASLLKKPSTRTEEAVSSPTSTSSPSPLMEASSTPIPVPSEAPSSISTQKLPYHVSRTPTNNLPIYSDIKAGKTLKLTRIRKITGDVQALKNEIIQALKLDPEREKAEVNPLTGHIVIKGRHTRSLQKFLTEKGF
jgi:large subunit ribosomal protein L49